MVLRNGNVNSAIITCYQKSDISTQSNLVTYNLKKLINFYCHIILIHVFFVVGKSKLGLTRHMIHKNNILQVDPINHVQYSSHICHICLKSSKQLGNLRAHELKPILINRLSCNFGGKDSYHLSRYGIHHIYIYIYIYIIEICGKLDKSNN